MASEGGCQSRGASDLQVGGDVAWRHGGSMLGGRQLPHSPNELGRPSAQESREVGVCGRDSYAVPARNGRGKSRSLRVSSTVAPPKAHAAT